MAVVASALPGLAAGREQEHEKRGGHQKELDRNPSDAVGVEGPRIPVDQLEAEPGAVMPAAYRSWGLRRFFAANLEFAAGDRVGAG